MSNSTRAPVALAPGATSICGSAAWIASAMARCACERAPRSASIGSIIIPGSVSTNPRLVRRRRPPSALASLPSITLLLSLSCRNLASSGARSTFETSVSSTSSAPRAVSTEFRSSSARSSSCRPTAIARPLEPSLGELLGASLAPSHFFSSLSMLSEFCSRVQLLVPWGIHSFIAIASLRVTCVLNLRSPSLHSCYISSRTRY
eukprot:scaffold252678_cov31-Tisochrysis_lutea.AAC.2